MPSSRSELRSIRWFSTILRRRLEQTRITPGMAESGWDYGTSPAYLEDLCAYWRCDFDWRKQEKYLNEFAHFRCEVDDISLHFIHERGKGDNPIPLLLVHGRPAHLRAF
jgi:hypothetical protein